MKTLTRISILVLLLSFNNLLSQVPTNGLVAKNSIGSQNYSLSFQGNGYVQLPTQLVNNPNEFTIEAWVKPITQGSMNGMVFYNGQGGEIELEVGSDLGVAFLINLDTWYVAYSSTKLTSGRWTHIAGVYKRSEQKLKIFINGILEATVSTPNVNMRQSGYNSMIGSYGDAVIQKYKGNIDEVRFSNVARYSSNFSPSTDFQTDANTVGLWKFNEGTGNIAYDGSGHGYNGNIVGAQWSSDFPDCLVAYYPFNGNANDESGNGNNGIVNGATLTSDRFGNINGAYRFNGFNSPGCIRIPNSNSLVFTNGASFSIWVKINSTSGINGTDGNYTNNGIQCIFAKDHDARNAFFSNIDFYSQSDKIQFPFEQFSSSNPFPTIPKNTFQIGSWNHYVISYSINQIRVYWNGINIGTVNTTVDFTQTNLRDLYFAKFSDYWYPFFGDLDDARIYNRVLSDAEVQTLYHEGGWQQFTVTTASNPANAGTTSGSGVYNTGANVLVVATPNSGYIFLNWTENGNILSTSSTYQFTLTSNKNLVANFATKPTLSVTPLYIGVSPSSGTGSFAVNNTTGGTMNWTATPNVSWINIISGSSGTNNGSINFNYQTNSGNSRVGSITVTAPEAAGSPQTVEVRQDKLLSVEDETIPTKFSLYQNYPNPFNPTTTIQYQVPTQSYVVIKLFTLLGQEIRTLVSGEKTQGRYEFLIDGTDLVSGVYFCQMIAGNFVDTKKLILMK